MKALTLTQPWAQLVVLGKKQYETRSWRTNYRGPLAIHAGQRSEWGTFDLRDESQYFAALGIDKVARNDQLPTGAVVGVVRLVDVLPAEEAAITPDGDEAAFGDFSPGRWAWRLENALWRERPIECKGALGLWELPTAVERLVMPDSW